MVLFHLFFLLHPIIWPRVMVIIDLFIDLFILFAHDHLTNIYGPLSFALSFEKDHSTKLYGLLSFSFSSVDDHSTKNQGPHWFISFIYTRPFAQNICSYFIYSFFGTWPLDQNIWSSFIYSFLCKRPLDQKLRSSLIYFIFAHDHSIKTRDHCYSLIYSFLNGANISYAIFMAELPLFFVRYIHVSITLIFSTLYTWLYGVLRTQISLGKNYGNCRLE